MIQFCAKVQKPYFCHIFAHFWPLFALNIENENFPRYEIYTESYPTIRRLILGHIWQNLMTQFFSKVQKPYFWAFWGLFGHFLPIFRKMRIFPKNPALSLLSIYGPLTSCKISEKTNEPIPRKVHY